MPVVAERFDEFFVAANGVSPFPWQRALATSVCAGSAWPQVLALPTASGKTACIDIAVFALACSSQLDGAHRSAPRRVFFTVDRRIIVDEAFERGEGARRQAEERHGRHSRGGCGGVAHDGRRRRATRLFPAPGRHLPGRCLGQEPAATHGRRDDGRPDRISSALSKLRALVQGLARPRRSGRQRCPRSARRSPLRAAVCGDPHRRRSLPAMGRGAAGNPVPRHLDVGNATSAAATGDEPLERRPRRP